MYQFRFFGFLLLLSPASWALDVLDLSTAGQWFQPVRERPSIRLQSAYGWESPGRQRDEEQRSLTRNGGYALVAGRVWRDERQEVVVRAGAVDIKQYSDVVLPETGALPEQLQDVRIGAFWRTVSADTRTVLGLDVESSSPSDVPYSGNETESFSATAFAGLPSGERDSWILGLRYDSNRSFAPGVPLPAVAYRFDHSPAWTAIIGLPVTSIEGSLAPQIRGLLLWSLVDVFKAEVQWLPGNEQRTFLAPWIVSLGASQTGETWLRADREDEDQRLYYRTGRVYLAGEYQPFPGNRLRLAGGWIPYRFVQESDSVFSSENRVHLDPAWFGSLGLRLAY